MTQPVKNRKSHTFAGILFVIYLLVLLLLLFLRAPRTGHAYNLTPLQTIRQWLDFMGRDDPVALSIRPYAIMNLFGNVAAFIPLGIFLPILFPGQKKIWLFLLTVVLFVCLIEFAQLVTMRGALDVDDLILNVPGACLGWLIWRILPRKTE